MTDALVRTPTRTPGPRLSPRSLHYATKSKAENTKRAYKSAFADFAGWCADEGRTSLPCDPVAVSDYCSHLADLGAKVSTIEQRLAAIASFHKSAGFSNPTDDARVDAVMEGIRRDLKTKPHGKAALLREDLAALVEQQADDLRGLRNKALLLLGFAGAFRRSELCGLTMADLEFRPDALVVTLEKSKSDQEGAGIVKTIPRLDDAALCPVRAVKAWLKDSGIQDGPLFRAIDQWGHLRTRALTPQYVRLLVRDAASAAGLKCDDFGAHSLRVGFVSQASADGMSTEEIMTVTAHKSPQMVMRYNREKERLQIRTIKAALGEEE